MPALKRSEDKGETLTLIVKSRVEESGPDDGSKKGAAISTTRDRVLNNKKTCSDYLLGNR